MKYKQSEITLIDIMPFEMTVKANYLDKIDFIIDWTRIEKILLKKISKIKSDKSAAGAKAYHPLLMFKIILLQRFENLSDPQMETALSDRLSFMKFTGLTLSDKKPDHSTISRFRTLLVKLKLDQRLFKEVNKQLESRNLKVKTRKEAIVDATVISSCRHPRKVVNSPEEDRKEKDNDNDKNGSNQGLKKSKKKDINQDVEISYSDDKEAKWLIKRGELFYGFKAHASTNKEGFVESIHVTGANRSDTKELEKVLNNSNLEEGAEVLADKGYTSKSNREFLLKKKYKDKIMHKASKNKPLSEEEKAQNKEISKERFRVEQTFGILKKYYKLSRAKYVGIKKVGFEFLVSSICLNLKKAVNKFELKFYSNRRYASN